MATERDCVEALREAARRLGESPSKAQYEDLELTPASATVIRTCGGWNRAKERAGLETFTAGSLPPGEVAPKPECVELPDDETWEDLSPHQRWYRENREHQEGKKRRRRAMLRKWLYQYKSEHCAYVRCDETDPACLDFHHQDVTEKRDDVSRLVARGFARERIRDEIEKCEVLCANCHRKEHYVRPDDG
jgi:hypothetical protein